MEERIAESGGLELFRQKSGSWVTYRFEVGGKPGQDDFIDVFGAFSQAANDEAGPVCVVLDGLPQPNSKMLAALVGLLVARDGSERRVALAGATRMWVDMLDILGVRAKFLMVDGPEDLAS